MTHVFIVGTAVQLAWNALQLGAPLGDDLRALQQASLRAVVYASFVIALEPCPALAPAQLVAAAAYRRRAGAAPEPPLVDCQPVGPGGAGGRAQRHRRRQPVGRVLVHALFALLLSLTVRAQALGHMRAAPAASDADAGAPHGQGERPLWLA